MIPDRLMQFTPQIPVLDGQGYVALVDVMGDDAAVVEAARVSTGRGASAHAWGDPVETWARDTYVKRTCKVCGETQTKLAHQPWEEDGACAEGDRRFIRYLMRHRHTSPFEMCEIKLRIRMPIFVARQWVRHRTASLNEYSGRYSEMIDAALTTLPGAWRGQDMVNRQGSAGVIQEWPEGWDTSNFVPDGLTPGAHLTNRETAFLADAREIYEERLRFGVAREQARKDLPLSTMTEWYWKIDLHNLLHFLSLRKDGDAQKEIREYADLIGDIVRIWCPATWDAFKDWRLDAVIFSGPEIRALHKLLAEINAGGVEAREILGIGVALGLPLKDVPPAERKDFLRKLGV